jgi:hypothetical protein
VLAAGILGSLFAFRADLTQPPGRRVRT